MLDQANLAIWEGVDSKSHCQVDATLEPCAQACLAYEGLGDSAWALLHHEQSGSLVQIDIERGLTVHPKHAQSLHRSCRQLSVA